jgi:hypothetical protein
MQEELKEALDALKAAYDAMNYLGDILNAHDMVEPEDEKATDKAFGKARLVLSKHGMLVDEQLIIHDKCGLPVELCECPDAEVKYDYETDKFIDQKTEDRPPEE